MSTKTKTPTTASAAPVSNTIMTGEMAGSALTSYGTNPTELVLPNGMHESDYLAYGSKIGAAMEFAQWRIGDYCNFGKTTYGYKDYGKIAAVTGLSEQYLRDAASVAGRVPAELRAMHSLEKFRLMLSRKNDKESINHLVKRLGGKTQRELRKMSGTGRPPKDESEKEATATTVYKAAQKVGTLAETLTPDKWPALASFEFDQQTGGAIEMAIGNLKALLDALKDQQKNGEPANA